MNIHGYHINDMNRATLLITIIVCVSNIAIAQNYNVNNNNNNNNIIINNQPVIERVKYIEKYRTIYLEKPQPKRHARKLASPVCILGVYVYIEDLGDFNSLTDAQEIINRLNATGAFGRNNWRIPTSAELTLMEQNANTIGLGEGIYLATSHCNGILRPVATGPTIAEQNAANQAAEKKRQKEIEAERRRKFEENKRKEERRRVQQVLINSGEGISDGHYLIWAPTNIGATSSFLKGNIYSSYTPLQNWRLPSSRELSSFINKASFTQRPYNGYMVKIYTYKDIILLGGRYLTNDGYFDVGTSNGLTGNKGYVRLVQDIE